MYGVGSGLLTDLPIQTGVYTTGWCGMQEEEWDAGCRCAVRMTDKGRAIQPYQDIIVAATTQ